ncbi:MAG: maltose ABC transporter substrate-binding protein [Caldilineaceae bacterium]|nr:maltose ABC transporter substrate-binding protein [Caldilineaceae bacterium]
MKNRALILISVLMVLSLALVACGAPATPAPQAAPAAAEATAVPTAEPTAAATEAPTAVADAAPTEAPVAEGGCVADAPSLTIWADSNRAPVLRKIGDAFEAEFGVCVGVVEKGFDDIRDDFKVAAPTGEGPDIIIGAHDWLGDLVSNGLLAEMDLGDKDADFLDAAKQGFIYDGALYGMPYATENVALIYNPEIVKEVPTTWTGVTELSAQLEADGVVKQGYILQQGDPYHFFPIQTAFGGYVFGVDESGYNADDVGIDSEGSIAAATWLDQMVKDGHLKADISGDTMFAQFQNADAAMMISGPWALNSLRESGIPYAIAKLPGEVQDAQPFMSVQGFMVSAFSNDPLLAQTFLLDFVATEDAMQSIFDADPRPAAYLAVRDKIDDPDLLGFAAAGTNGLPMPSIPAMNSVWSAWGDAITLIFQQSEAPDVAFKQAAEQIRTAIAEK